MQNRLMQLVEDANKKADLPDFQVGDTVEVHQRILEGQKERVQIFTGDVIARKGAGLKETFTVRRLVQSEGVERIFLVHSPKIAKIVIKRRGKVRRAKLYYLRKRVGKATRLKEREKASPAKTAAKTEAPAANATPTA